MSRSLYNIIPGGDVRDQRWIDPSSSIDPNYTTSINPRNTDVLVIDKYPGNDDFNLVNDIMIFRSTEMLFVLIESAINDNNLSTAALFMQQLKNTRRVSGTAPVVSYQNAEEAWNDVLNERRMDFWLEGHRYIDMKRLAEKANASGFVKDPIDCEVANTSSNCNLSIIDETFKFTLPIPLTELNGNSQAQQNPNY